MPVFKFHALQEFDVEYTVEADTVEQAENLLWSGYGLPGEQWPGDIQDLWLDSEEI